jgi:dTDP-4-amino-4,6-dideoxygalactose transaminase
MTVSFNKPYYPPGSWLALYRAASAGTISGNGKYTQLCHRFFEETYGFRKSLLTTSCSDALEMAAILAGIKPGDEVIMPSFTFVSTANAFLVRGAKVIFADTLPDVPNIDPEKIEPLLTPKTKAMVVVHYSGIACDMDRIMAVAGKHKLFVIEDAAHSIDSWYKGKALGSIGHFGTFSFHETKNIFCGEGGMLTVNDEHSLNRAEIIWEKGTNRAAFYRGEISKYGWVDVGSSYLPSDALASFLWIQLKNLDRIQRKRISIWNRYFELLKPLEEKKLITLPVIPSYATVNGNLFYLLTQSYEEREKLLAFLNSHGIKAVFHYPPLHSSPYFTDKYEGRALPNTDRFSQCIVRLPFYYGLKKKEIRHVVNKIREYYGVRL